MFSLGNIPCSVAVFLNQKHSGSKSVLQDENEHCTSPRPFGMKMQHEDKYQPSRWFQHLQDFSVLPPKPYRQQVLNSCQQGEQTTGGEINYEYDELAFLWPVKAEENLMYH